MSERKPPDQPDPLTPEQRERLRSLREEITLDKITCSFSIEDRDSNGRRKSAFYSVNATRGMGVRGWSLDEVRLVRALVSAHVVTATYDDAFRRRVLPFNDETRAERTAIVASYETQVRSLLGGVNKGSGDPSEGAPPTS